MVPLAAIGSSVESFHPCINATFQGMPRSPLGLELNVDLFETIDLCCGVARLSL